MAHTLAIDLGGTNMRAAVVDREGEILDRVQAKTPHDRPTIEPLLDLVRPLASRPEVEHAVAGVPSRVDHEAGTLLNAPNLPPPWPALISRSTLEHELGLPVSLANDADVAAVGVVNLAHIASPSIVVVGGGVGRHGELVNAPIRAALERFGPRGPAITVVTAGLGDDSGLRGAAAWRDAT